jgi:hypothetical protein
MNSDQSLDDVLNALSVANIPTTPPKTPSKDKEYVEEDILRETLEAVDELIAANSEVLEENRRLVESTGDKDYLETYASVSKSQAEAIKMKMKLLTDKEKNKDFRETKYKEIAVKEKLVDYQIGDLENKKNALPAGATLNQTNIIMPGASREEALKFVREMQLAEKSIKEGVVVDV